MCVFVWQNVKVCKPTSFLFLSLRFPNMLLPYEVCIHTYGHHKHQNTQRSMSQHTHVCVCVYSNLWGEIFVHIPCFIHPNKDNPWNTRTFLQITYINHRVPVHPDSVVYTHSQTQPIAINIFVPWPTVNKCGILRCLKLRQIVIVTFDQPRY